VFTAGFWPVIVDVAVMVFAEKRTWRRTEHEIAVFINPQVLLDKITRAHTQSFRDPRYVVLVKDRTCGLAAIGTPKAFHLGEYRIVNCMKSIIYFPGILLLKPGKKLSVFR